MPARLRTELKSGAFVGTPLQRCAYPQRGLLVLHQRR